MESQAEEDPFAVPPLVFGQQVVRTNPVKPIVLYVIAEIAAGKSTAMPRMVEALEALGFSVESRKENIDLWMENGLFQAFCADPKRYSIEFQQFAMVTRIQGELELYERNPNADVYLLERSVFCDLNAFIYTLYHDGLVTESQLKCYKYWWNTWARLMPYEPTGFIRLEVSMEEMMSRVQGRARDGEESKVTLDYQTKLRKAHDRFVALLQTNPSQLGLTNRIQFFGMSAEEDYRKCPERLEKFVKPFQQWVQQLVLSAQEQSAQQLVQSLSFNRNTDQLFTSSRDSEHSNLSVTPELEEPVVPVLKHFPDSPPQLPVIATLDWYKLVVNPPAPVQASDCGRGNQFELVNF